MGIPQNIVKLKQKMTANFFLIFTTLSPGSKAEFMTIYGIFSILSIHFQCPSLEGIVSVLQ